jgi:hypothetical protein
LEVGKEYIQFLLFSFSDFLCVGQELLIFLTSAFEFHDTPDSEGKLRFDARRLIGERIWDCSAATAKRVNEEEIW